MISTAYQMESSSLFSVVQKEMQQRNKTTPGGSGTVTQVYSSFHPNSSWKQKPAV